LPELIQHLEARRRPIETPYYVLDCGQQHNTDLYLSIPTSSIWVAFPRSQRLTHRIGASAVVAASGRAGAIVYNLFPRLTTAFDHNGDGEISIGPVPTAGANRNALKCIALLALYPQYGFNTVTCCR